MIAASALFSDIRSLLDDDSSGRYTITDDLVPALNASIDFWVTILNAGFEQKRILHESLADLVKTTYQPVETRGSVGVVDLDDSENIWTIFRVDTDVEADIEGEGEEQQIYKIGEGKPATRVSLKEWGFETGNPFAIGTTQAIVEEFQRVIYIGIGNYLGREDEKGILLRPASLLGDGVLIWFLKNPDRVEDDDSNVEFPMSMYNLLVQKAVNYISYQHGGQAPYFQFTDKEINQVAQVLMT